MKKVSIVVPCYNEEENVQPLSRAIIEEFAKHPNYDYEILFIDNDSRDQTRSLLRKLCAENPRIRAILNAKNFGQFNSPYYGLLQATGDCAILMAADFQDPVEMIGSFLQGWEEGYKIVIGIKTQSEENRLMYFLRSCYYKMIKKLSDVEQIEQFTGFGLYDRKFLEVLKKLDDPTPFLRGIVAELGFRRKEIPYTQPQRRAGKTSNNFYRLFDAAMLSFTSYTTVGLRIATLLGMVCSVLFMVIALVYLVMKLINWYNFPAGMAPVLIGMCLLGSIQLFFIGLIGEYIMSINNRVKRRPLVVEEERLNFPGSNQKRPKSDEKRSEVKRDETMHFQQKQPQEPKKNRMVSEQQKKDSTLEQSRQRKAERAQGQSQQRRAADTQRQPQKRGVESVQAPQAGGSSYQGKKKYQPVQRDSYKKRNFYDWREPEQLKTAALEPPAEKEQTNPEVERNQE